MPMFMIFMLFLTDFLFRSLMAICGRLRPYLFFFYSHPVSFYDDNSEDDYIHVLLPLSAEISRCFGMVLLMTVIICLHYSIYILL